jgi:hypothetical protein
VGEPAVQDESGLLPMQLLEGSKEKEEKKSDRQVYSMAMLLVFT